MMIKNTSIHAWDSWYHQLTKRYLHLHVELMWFRVAAYNAFLYANTAHIQNTINLYNECQNLYKCSNGELCTMYIYKQADRYLQQYCSYLTPRQLSLVGHPLFQWLSFGHVVVIFSACSGENKILEINRAMSQWKSVFQNKNKKIPLGLCHCRPKLEDCQEPVLSITWWEQQAKGQEERISTRNWLL